MTALAERLEFAPPPQPGLWRGFALALLAHGLLLAALTWGVSWNHQAQTLAVEAELWSALPQAAAPKAQEAPPPPPAPPAPVQAKPDPQVQAAREAEIALARERQRKEEQARAAEEQARQARLKREAEEQRRKQAAAQQQAQARAAQEDARKLEQQRQENLRRIAGMAGASGAPGASGTAQQSSGPSASYAGRIRARIRPNIVYTEDISGNPTAEVEVRTAPDGTIVGRRLLQSSGLKAWDEAVLKAIDKTEVLPRDVDGRVPSSLVISFRPKD